MNIGREIEQLGAISNCGLYVQKAKEIKARLVQRQKIKCGVM